MDEDGYPTEEELETVRKWKYSDFHGLMEYVKSLWNWNGYGFERKGDIYEVSTYGWSGNEDLIWAMKQNQMFWILHWEQSRRGGHYIFSKRFYQ
jgi:hypothetical protein